MKLKIFVSSISCIAIAAIIGISGANANNLTSSTSIQNGPISVSVNFPGAQNCSGVNVFATHLKSGAHVTNFNRNDCTFTSGSVLPGDYVVYACGNDSFGQTYVSVGSDGSGGSSTIEMSLGECTQIE